MRKEYVNLKEKTYLLGRNIAKFRKEKNLSQNALAEIIDISREHLAKIETGKRNISLKLLFKLCESINIEEKTYLILTLMNNNITFTI